MIASPQVQGKKLGEGIEVGEEVENDTIPSSI